jgi:hypothetical protein
MIHRNKTESGKEQNVSANRIKLWVRMFRSMVIGALLALVGMVAGGYVYINQAGGLRQFLETELTILAGAGAVTVGEAHLGLAMTGQPLAVTAKDIVIDLDQSRLDLPDVELQFGFASLFNGRPEAVILRGVQLDLVRQKQGWSGSAELLFMGQVGARSAAHPDAMSKSRLAGIKRIAVETDRLSLRDADGVRPPIILSDIHIDLVALADDDVSGSMRARRVAADGGDDGSFTVAFNGWPTGDNLLLDVSASGLQTADIASYIDGVPVVWRTPGRLSGHVGLAMTAGHLDRIKADVDLVNGQLGVPGVDQMADFDEAKLIFSYARARQTLIVSSAELTLAGGRRLSFSGSVDETGAPTPLVAGKMQATRLSVQSVLDAWPSGVAPDWKQAISQRFGGGSFQTIDVGVDGRYNVEQSRLALTRLDLDSRFSAVRANLDAGQYRRMVATLDGQLAVRVAEGGRIDDVLVDVAVKDGSMLLAGLDDAVAIQAGHLRTSFRGTTASLDSFALDFGPAGRMDLSGMAQIGRGLQLRDVTLGLSVPEMDIALFSALWPEWAAPATRRWVGRNILAGRVKAAKLSMAADLDTPDNVRKIHQVSGDLQLQSADLVWQTGAPPLTAVDADLSWDNDIFVAGIQTGRFDDLTLQRGRIVIEPVLEKVDKNAVISLAASGGVKAALQLAAHAGYRQFGGIDFGNLAAAGDIEFTLEASVPIKENAPLSRRISTLDATIAKGSFTNLPRGITMSDAELVIGIGKAASQVTGTANLSGAPGSFTMQIDHEQNRLDLIGQAPPAAALARMAADLTGVDIGGKLGGKLVYGGDPSMQNSDITLILDLQGTAVNVPVLNWAKLPAENGRASMKLVLRDGVLGKLTDLDIAAGSLFAAGQVIFDASGMVQAALFERAAWPGNDLRDLIVERGADRLWKIGATAKLVNLEPLRRNKGVSGGKAVAFDFTSDKIIIDNKISLSGQLVGKRDQQGDGTVAFLGTFQVDNKPLITEAKLDMAFGPDGERFSGTGLIGGGESNIDYRALKDQNPVMVIETTNGGRVLSGLDVTETIRGGDMRLTNRFLDDALASYDTDIKLKNFRVVEAPRALRLFSVLSPVGLYALVEGDGTNFRVGEARLETRGNIVNIKSITGLGDAIGVSILGIYDRSNRTIDLSGNLVPARFVGRFLGNLPILGELIAGVDKNGIFVSEFKMSGALDKPTTKVNPVTSLAPGVVRDILSPNWIGREQERLFGKSPNQSSPDQSKTGEASSGQTPATSR